MSTYAAPIEVFRAAMPLVGANPPQSMTDQTAEAVMANAVYEGLVADALTRHAWSFATKSKALTYQGTSGDSPAYVYSLPSDVLTPRRLLYAGSPWKDYEMRGNKLLADVKDESSNFRLVYNWRAPESAWPSDFSWAVVRLLAAQIARGLLDRANHGDNLEAQAEARLRVARVRDRRSYQGPERDVDAPLVRAWRGSSRTNTGTGSTTIQSIPAAGS